MVKGRKVVLYSGIGMSVLLVLLAGLLIVLMQSPNASADMQPAAGIQVDGAVVQPAAGDSATTCTQFSDWVGKAVDEAAVKATGRVYRILTPGMAATMDFLEGRINVLVDDQNVVLQVTCG